MTTFFKLKILEQPFNLFLLAAVLLFVFSFATSGRSLDLHLHDTYFVIPIIFFIWLLALLFLLFWAIYKLTDIILWTRFLTWFHVLVTLCILIIFLTISAWHDTLLPPLKREFVSFATLQQDRQRASKVFGPLIILLALGQFVFVLNILGGLIKKSLQKGNST